ncbi:MAG: hypothetical protein QW051_02840 [Candidatus Aenigmatarchaeota archaeon]
MNKKIAKFLIFNFSQILVFLLGFFHFVFAANPYLYVSPASLEKKIGETFSVSVAVNPQNNKVCVVEGKINLNNLSCQSVNLEEGIIPQASPSCNNLYFLLGVPGCTTNNTTLFKVILKGQNTGNATVNFSGVDIIGEGTSISSASVGGNYNIISSCTCSAWGSWQNGECGEGNCPLDQRIQTRERSCNPSKCDIERESRCVKDQNCVSESQTIAPLVEGETTTITPLVEGETTTPQLEEITSTTIETKTERKIIFPEEIKVQKENLLANLIAVWGGKSQFIIIVTVTILFLVTLLFIISKEWKRKEWKHSRKNN